MSRKAALTKRLATAAFVLLWALIGIFGCGSKEPQGRFMDENDKGKAGGKTGEKKGGAQQGTADFVP